MPSKAKGTEEAQLSGLGKALEKALAEEDSIVVSFLLRQGAPVKQEYLRIAADVGDAKKVEALLQHAGGSFPRKCREKIIMKAIKEEHVEVVEKLLGAGGVDHQTLAHHVAKTAGLCSQELIKLLVDQGADLNSEDEDGDTPLFWAAGNGNHLAAKALILHGADPNIAADSVCTPLFWACHRGHLQTAKEMTGADPNGGSWDDSSALLESPLHEACARGDPDMITWLVKEAGANPCPWSRRESPFECALRTSDKHNVMPSFLIQLGIDPWQKNMIGAHEGDTALHTIVRMRETKDDDLRIELIKDLLACVPNMVNAKNREEATALHWATLLSKKVIRFLVEKCGADLAAKDIRGRTPLMEASFEKQLASVECLLALCKKQSADIINITDKEGRTALHWAVFVGCHPIINILLKAGANCNILTENGRLPLHLVGYPFSEMDLQRDVCSYCEFDVTRILTTRPCEAWKTTCESNNVNRLTTLATLISCTYNSCTRDKDGNLPFFMAAITCHVSETFLMLRDCDNNGLFGPKRPKKRTRRGNRDVPGGQKKATVIPSTAQSGTGIENPEKIGSSKS